MRTSTPFIEAFRKQQSAPEVVPLPSVPVEKIERDLSPKTMSDSYHRTVSLKCILVSRAVLIRNRSYLSPKTHGFWIDILVQLVISD